MKRTECQDVLVDKSTSGKTRNWKLHKIHSAYISAAYQEFNSKKAERMEKCAEWLSFVRREDGTLKLHDARFCRVRLCPICQWRRSLKTFAQMSQVLERAAGEGYQFIFLTLTVKNCEGAQLRDELSHILLSFNRLMKYKDVQKVIHGYYRGCEVTHNIQSDEYHPHIHAILAVKSTYFKGKYYLKQERWTELWKKALHVKML